MADTGWLTFAANTGPWTSGGNMITSNDGYATETAENQKHILSNWGASIPAGQQIDGIEAKYEIKTICSWSNDVTLELSWDGGTSWTAQKKFSGATPVSDTIYTVGGAADAWGYGSWTIAIINSTTLFKARIDSGTMKLPACLTGQSAEIYCDMVQVKVYYSLASVGGIITKQTWTP